MRLIYSMAAALLVVTSPLHGQVMDPQWSQPFRFSTPGTWPEPAHVVSDTKGNSHVVWLERKEPNGKVEIRYTRFDGESWSKPALVYAIPPGLKVGSLDLTIDRDDNLHVIWTSLDTGFTVGEWPAVAPVMYTRVPAADALVAANWLQPVLVPATALRARLRAGTDGKLNLIYSDAFSANPGIYYKFSADSGSTWSDPLRVDKEVPKDQYAYYVALALDSSNGLHAVWEYKSGWQTAAILYAGSADGGMSWSSPATLDKVTNDPSEIQYGTPLIATQDQTIHVEWMGGGFANVGRRHRYSFDGGRSWSPIGQLFGNMNAAAWVESFFVNPQGILHLMDFLRFPEGMYDASWDGERWSVPRLIYLTQKDAADPQGDRLRIGSISAATPGGQVVTTFTHWVTDDKPLVLYSMHTPKPILYLPYFVDGDGLTVNVALTNLADKLVKAAVGFFDAAGRRLEVAAEPRLSGGQWMEIGAYATQALATTGSSSPQVGYARLEFDQFAPVSVTAVLQNRLGSDVTLFPLKPGRRFAAFVERSATIDTAVAVVRFSSEPVEIALFDTGGVLVNRRTWDQEGVQAMGKISDMFDVPPIFQGYVQVSSAGDIAPLVLRTGDRALSGVPVVDLDWTPEPASYYFPHYADGDGWSTTFVSTNYTADAVEGRLMFFDSTGKPRSMVLAGGGGAEIALNLGGNASQVLTTSGPSSPLTSGYAKLEMNRKAGGMAIFKWHSGLETCVPAMRPGRRFGVRVERSPALETAVGLLRLSAAPVRFRLYDTLGSLVQSGLFPIANSQQAKLVSDVAALPPDFAGLLVLEADGDFAPVALRVGREALSTAPVVAF